MNQIDSSEIIPCHPPYSKRFKNISGAVFGRLKVQSLIGKKLNINGHVYVWKCLCECGKTSVASTGNLTQGCTKSCGCLRSEKMRQSKTTHGMKGTPEHAAWSDMFSRCNNNRVECFVNYGARGISVCERWLKFENFYADMGPKPTPKHSIDRINNDGNYEPSNCKWSTKKEQLRNTRQNVSVTYNGKTLCASEWDEMLGFPKTTTLRRIRAGWDASRALTESVRLISKNPKATPRK